MDLERKTLDGKWNLLHVLPGGSCVKLGIDSVINFNYDLHQRYDFNTSMKKHAQLAGYIAFDAAKFIAATSAIVYFN